MKLKLEGGRIILMTPKVEPRKGWEQAFSQMSKNRDDELVITDDIDLDTEEWEW